MGLEVWGCQTFFLGPFCASLGPGQRDTWVRAFLRYPCVASPAIVFAPLLLLFFLRILFVTKFVRWGRASFDRMNALVKNVFTSVFACFQIEALKFVH
jgi:hypothetical protein